MKNHVNETPDKGTVLELQKFSVNDGDGIRTVIFLIGCPLRCKWCSNPDAWEPVSGLYEEISVGGAIRRIERDAVFFRHSGGGVTFSGGEPTVQQNFLRALAKEFYDRGISMWMETCGYFDFEEVKDVLLKMEHIFYDIKYIDKAMHKEYTGRDNDLILKNAARVFGLGIPVTVRVPAVKDITFTEKNLTETARFMRDSLPGAPVEFLPYHNLGMEKYNALGLKAPPDELAAPGKQEITAAKELFKSYGIESVEYR